jgi:hypothetical protein
VSKTELFDKIVNIEFIPKSGKSTFLTCPKTGRKPSISLTGQFTGGIVSSLVIKITNLYLAQSLDSDKDGGSSYEFIKIVVGYGGKLYAAIMGQVFVAYQIKPGPDHEVIMECYIASYEQWITTPYPKDWPIGTSLNTIFMDMASLLSTSQNKVGLKSYISDSVCLTAPSFSCSSLFEAADKLSKAYELNAVPEGDKLIIIPVTLEGVSSGIIHTLDYITSVNKTGSGLTINAPWLPDVRPYDTVRIDSKYFSTDYGGTFVRFGTDFLVITVDFSFSTNGTENNMSILAIGV